MQGVFVQGARPKFKKTLREDIATMPEQVRLEATSFFGNEYDGPLTEAPAGTYTVVGPDPHRKRDWYATITVGTSGELSIA
jgi:hypothetical protein